MRSGALGAPWAALILALVLALAGCREEAPVQKPVAVRPFTPPADGVLRPAQVEMWLAVRERGRARGETEGQAARALGRDPKEIVWVGERIGEARRLAGGRGLEERIAAARARFRAALVAERRTASSVRQKEIDRLLAEFPPAVAAGGGPAARNAEVIASYAEKLEVALAPPARQKDQVERRAGQ